MSSTKLKTLDEVVSTLSLKFPELNFSKFTYVNQNTPGVFTCPVHGDRSRTYKDMMRTKYGCDLCETSVKKDTTKALAELMGLYGEEVMTNYDTSGMVYVNARTGLDIVCNRHGLINPRPLLPHLVVRKAKTPCKYCNIELRAADQYDTKESFLSKIPEKFAGKDSFENSVYLGSKIYMDILCLVNPEHGIYPKRPNDYMNGFRCPDCSQGGTSIGEIELRSFCNTLAPSFKYKDCRVTKDHKPDIVIPSHKLIVEYHGVYHHREQRVGDNDCVEKLDYYKSIGFNLIQVFEDEWIFNRPIVEARLKSKMGLDERIFARNTVVKKITASEAKVFMDTNHLQGGGRGNDSFCYGLFHEDKLVSAATFSSPSVASDRERCTRAYELRRYASLLTVVGGFSKLFKAFKEEASPWLVVSFADRRWSEGEVYGINGFKRINVTAPGYWWCKAQRRVNRQNFQLFKLKELPEFRGLCVEGATEESICTAKGYVKTFDAGNVRWEWTP